MATLWYFAYGSNMQSATLRGRRGVSFRRALAGRADGWRLTLDKSPLVPVPGTFANIVPDPAACVFGVLFEVTAEDLEHIELTEGVRLGNYRRVDLSVQPLAVPSEPIVAVSLTSDRRELSGAPMQSYMELLIAGALEHGLPAEYVAFLRGVPTAPDSPEGEEGRALIDEALRAITRRP